MVLECAVPVAKQNAHGIRTSFQNNQVRTMVAIHIPQSQRDSTISRHVVHMCLEVPSPFPSNTPKVLFAFRTAKSSLPSPLKSAAIRQGRYRAGQGFFPTTTFFGA